MQKVSFIIPSRDNLKYLKLAYQSIRKNMNTDHEICIADDNSKDDTWKWLQNQKKQDKNLKLYRNNSGTRYGLTILYDLLINEIATNDIIIACHTDMYYGPNFVKNLIKHHKEGRVVCATRIEPPLHPAGREKIVKNFGIDIEDFKEDKLISFIQKNQSKNKGETYNGFFAPWLISKKDFKDIGGHDPLFRPQSREDSDLANRLYLNDNDLIQSRDSFVYHFTCRGSRFKDGIGKNSVEWQRSNYKAERNFIRKWGSMVKNTSTLLPVINSKYDIQLIFDCRDNMDRVSFGELLRLSEPYFNSVIINDPHRLYETTVKTYIKNENQITDYAIDDRIIYNPQEDIEHHDIEIFTQPSIVSQDNGQFIQLVHTVFDNIRETGQYDFNGNKIRVNQLRNDYYLDNIYSDVSYRKYINE